MEVVYPIVRGSLGKPTATKPSVIFRNSGVEKREAKGLNVVFERFHRLDWKVNTKRVSEKTRQKFEEVEEDWKTALSNTGKVERIRILANAESGKTEAEKRKDSAINVTIGGIIAGGIVVILAVIGRKELSDLAAKMMQETGSGLPKIAVNIAVIAPGLVAIYAAVKSKVYDNRRKKLESLISEIKN